MQIKRMLSVMVLAGLLATGCTTMATSEPTQADAEAAIAAAEAARANAASVGGEWRDTGKMIKSAQAAAKKGDFAGAVKTANKAQRQGELGYEQAVSQKELKMPSYLKY